MPISSTAAAPASCTQGCNCHEVRDGLSAVSTRDSVWPSMYPCSAASNRARIRADSGRGAGAAPSSFHSSAEASTSSRQAAHSERCARISASLSSGSVPARYSSICGPRSVHCMSVSLRDAHERVAKLLQRAVKSDLHRAAVNAENGADLFVGHALIADHHDQLASVLAQRLERLLQPRYVTGALEQV